MLGKRSYCIAPNTTALSRYEEYEICGADDRGYH